MTSAKMRCPFLLVMAMLCLCGKCRCLQETCVGANGSEVPCGEALAAAPAGPPPPGKRCVQSLDIWNVSDMDLLRNCSVVDGFVRLLHFENVSAAVYENYQFPELVEITNYLVMYRVYNLTSIGKLFPNLAVIGGWTLFKHYSLVLLHTDLKEVGLTKLVKIHRGGVWISGSPGTGFVQSALLAEGFRASRRRVWQCLRRVDPIGTARRRRKCVTRRVYRTKGANYMWHIDSNHKLIMFRFVIHGCVDGFSRLVVHLNVATNNTGNTVLQFFKNSAEEFWLPKRVRADRGVENNRVRRYMQRKSAAKNPFIYGRSVHNTRIERLWRDVNIQVLYPFKVIFHTLEEVGILDESSNVDLWCLCYIYLPRIQHALDKFKTWWNNHTMRTMGNRTPIQMWMLKMRRQGEKSTSHIIDESDWEDDDDSDEDECNTSPLLNARMPIRIRDELQSIIPDPLADDGALGTIHYNTLRTHLLNIVSEDEADDSS